VILPGATDDEVMHLLLQKAEATTGHVCRYGHPYEPPPIFYPFFPCKVSTSQLMFTSIDLELIPYLPDDPKSRFISGPVDSRTTVSGTVVPPPAKQPRGARHQPTDQQRRKCHLTNSERTCVRGPTGIRFD